jgi:hypothetical protein
MAYNANKPAATDRLSVSQGDIQGNFAAIQTLIDVNHGDFGAATQGKHIFLNMPEQIAPPTVGADEAGLYSAQGATSTVAELVFRRESNGTTIAFTEGSLGAALSNTWSRFPSGLVLKCGYATAAGAGNFAVNLNGIGPAFGTLYNCQLTSASAGVTYYVATLVNATLTINASAAGNVFWQVWGKE